MEETYEAEHNTTYDDTDYVDSLAISEILNSVIINDSNPMNDDSNDLDSNNLLVSQQNQFYNDYTSSSDTTSNSSIINSSSEIGESSRLAAVFLLVNATLGAGLLNFPKAFDQAGGISVSLSVQLLLVACVCVGLLVIAHSSWRVHAATLQDTMAATWGARGSIFCSLLISLYCFGTCVTFLIIIGDQFDRVLMSLVGSTFCHTWFMNRHFTITASAVVFILPLCYSRKIDFLKYVSSLGVLAVLYVVLLVVFKYYTGDFVPGPIKTSPDHWTDIFYVVPVICFAYQCHVSVVPTYYCMSDRKLSSFTLVVIVTLVLCTLAYGLTGVFGYLTFGGRVSSDVLEDYNGADAAVLGGIAAIAIKTFTTYPIMLFCGREAVLNGFSKLGYDWDPCVEKRRRVCISTTFFVATVVFAVLSPNIGIVIDALGSIAAIFIFFLPSLCLFNTCLMRDPCLISTRTRLHLSAAIFFAAIGAFIVGVVLTQTINRLATNETSPPLCT